MFLHIFMISKSWKRGGRYIDHRHEQVEKCSCDSFSVDNSVDLLKFEIPLGILMEPREAASWGPQQTLSGERNLCRYEKSNVNRLQSHQIIFQTVRRKESTIVFVIRRGCQEHHSIFSGGSCSPGDNLRRRRILVAGGQDKHGAHTAALLSPDINSPCI